MRKTLKPIAFIFLLSLMPSVLFCIKGYSGVDFLFHLPSWMELRDTWLSGQLWSGWAFKANHTLGDPHFSFYPPFSFLLGAGLGILLPLRLVPIVYISLISLVSGLTMYVAGKRFLPEEDCLPGAFLYMLSPYMLMSQLIHFTIAELLVQAWLPLLLLWFFESIGGKKPRVLAMACLLGLSWLTDVPAAIAIFYSFLLISIVFAWERKRLAPALRFVAAEAIAGMLAVFYLLPVMVEQKWINTAGLLSRWRPSQFVFFLPGQWAADGKVPSEVFDEWGFVGLSLLAIAICLARHRRWREDPQIRFWIYLSLVTLFFFLPISLPAWDWLPEMHAVQFPARFLPFVGVALPMVLLAKGTPIKLRKPIYLLVLLLAIVPIQRFLRGNPITSLGKDAFGRMESELENRGYFSPPEYGNLSSKAFGLRPLDAGGPAAPAELCSMAPPPLQTTRVDFTTDASRPCTLVLDVYSYPYWSATTETGTMLATASDAKGLLSVAVPPGRHRIQVLFRPASRVRTVTAAVSLFAFAWVILGLIYGAVRRPGRDQKDHEPNPSEEVAFAGVRS